MELRKEHWTQNDIEKFEKYLQTFSKGKEKADMEKRIANTNLKTIAVPSFKIDEIVREIKKGNYFEFLDFMPWDNLSTTFINAKLLSNIKDFEIFKSYLIKYASRCDNWASCDTLKFNTNKNEENYFTLSKQLISSKKCFERRIGIRILFKFLDDRHIDLVFDTIKSLKDEKEYYVNMAISWLLCDAFIKQKEKTFEFFKSKNLSSFCFNKAISKCFDSFRVSKLDKQKLKSLKLEIGY